MLSELTPVFVPRLALILSVPEPHTRRSRGVCRGSETRRVLFTDLDTLPSTHILTATVISNSVPRS